MGRVRIRRSGGFISRSSVQFIPTGATVLNCALGGGWARGRVINIVGDKSTGKTLLAIEACANFAMEIPKGEIHYAESESAFDHHYAARIGMPSDRVKMYEDDETIETVEDCFDALETVIARKSRQPALFILDSLDALTTKAEQARELGEGTYGLEKQKMLGQLFRRAKSRLKATDTTFIIISQTRANIAAAFGKKDSRTGGKSLDFYASQIVWLFPKGKVTKVVKGVKRAIGMDTLARIEKNKVGPPFREAAFPILFEFGVEDVYAGIDWLIKHGRTDLIDLSKTDAEKVKKRLHKMDDDEYSEMRGIVSHAVMNGWEDVEASFRPRRRKYV